MELAAAHVKLGVSGLLGDEFGDLRYLEIDGAMGVDVGGNGARDCRKGKREDLR
jgi:hypothetical protein